MLLLPSFLIDDAKPNWRQALCLFLNPFAFPSRLLECVKPYTFQIVKCGIVVFGPASWIARLSIGNHNDHSLAGSREKHPARILLVGLTIWFLDDIPLFTDK